MAIEMNNYAVSELRRGDYQTAYKALSCAASLAVHRHQAASRGTSNKRLRSADVGETQVLPPPPSAGARHRQEGQQQQQQPGGDGHGNNAPVSEPLPRSSSSRSETNRTNAAGGAGGGGPTYQFAWVDCTGVLQKKISDDSNLNHGYAPFLCMKFLHIYDPNRPSQRRSQRHGLGPGRGGITSSHIRSILRMTGTCSPVGQPPAAGGDNKRHRPLPPAPSMPVSPPPAQDGTVQQRTSNQERKRKQPSSTSRADYEDDVQEEEEEEDSTSPHDRDDSVANATSNGATDGELNNMDQACPCGFAWVVWYK
jgi:hypothetical protein